MTELYQLKNAVIAAIDYMDHGRFCEIGQCDVCTCGMVKSREELKTAFNLVRQVCIDAEVSKCLTSSNS